MVAEAKFDCLNVKIKRMSKINRENTPAILSQYESMAQLSAATGMPHAAIRAAKAAGCPAFIPGGRIVTLVLLRWFFREFDDGQGEKPPEGLATWREALNRIQTKREELKLRQDEGLMMLTADAKRQASEASVHFMAELERRDRELPPALAGLSAIEIFKRMKADTESIRKSLTEKLNEVGK